MQQHMYLVQLAKTLHFFNMTKITPLNHNPALNPVELGKGRRRAL
jgi:hypothetical protein